MAQDRSRAAPGHARVESRYPGPMVGPQPRSAAAPRPAPVGRPPPSAGPCHLGSTPARSFEEVVDRLRPKPAQRAAAAVVCRNHRDPLTPDVDRAAGSTSTDLGSGCFRNMRPPPRERARRRRAAAGAGRARRDGRGGGATAGRRRLRPAPAGRAVDPRRSTTRSRRTGSVRERVLERDVGRGMPRPGHLEGTRLGRGRLGQRTGSSTAARRSHDRRLNRLLRELLSTRWPTSAPPPGRLRLSARAGRRRRRPAARR